MIKKTVESLAIHGALLIAALLTLLPVIWMVSTSLKPNDRIFTYPIEWWPSVFV